MILLGPARFARAWGLGWTTFVVDGRGGAAPVVCLDDAADPVPVLLDGPGGPESWISSSMMSSTFLQRCHLILYIDGVAVSQVSRGVSQGKHSRPNKVKRTREGRPDRQRLNVTTAAKARGWIHLRSFIAAGQPHALTPSPPSLPSSPLPPRSTTRPLRRRRRRHTTDYGHRDWTATRMPTPISPAC